MRFGRDALARQGSAAPLCSTGRTAKSGQGGPAPWTAGKLPSQSYIKAPLSRLSALPIWISIKPSVLRWLRSPFSHETAPPSRLSNRDLGFLTWRSCVLISNLAGTWFGVVCDGRCLASCVFFPRAQRVPLQPEDDTEKNRGVSTPLHHDKKKEKQWDLTSLASGPPGRPSRAHSGANGAGRASLRPGPLCGSGPGHGGLGTLI